ncbi:hypothetical protein AGABI1DRAFT_111729 [Agaricus bisporus var. burnettii JB137-S8]|uniref:Heme haloperoxidase family profile domain-containing protein n=1 Tax=Agaricus bisporus var. burnettii (strain JB137-S8 / ATCC MYA-4627 / FGSC 10392) TaxID=597362 RepID=K5XIY7_AGABU|nr:uncharacterized protein AGABI1DRAFT_111729 [Agaricus bisporus var. burnettii JB137-S8]EKM83297.1 hypothetical protein AGABI1DRAFT_111729 [Agaricus bisporus var. burnettii JB137-S8]
MPGKREEKSVRFSVMVGFISFVALAIALVAPAAAFPAHGSLAGLSRQELDDAMSGFGKYKRPPPPPGPLEYGGVKLVNDAEHPFKPPRKGDIRGPCPALNTLANHGYISRNGIESPSNIVRAAMEGFNMNNDLAKFTCYAAFIVNGNMVTDLVSIGEKSKKTGPDPKDQPATIGGLNTHNVFEGDSSMTRADFYDGGDVESFNETLFQGFLEYSYRFGGGRYNLTAAGEYRLKRTQDGIQNNPTFTIVAPRLFSAYSESVNPINLWVDGRQDDGQLRLDHARSFFEAARYPDDFHRAARPMSADNEAVVHAIHPLEPGANVAGVNTYTVDRNAPRLDDKCGIFEYHVNTTLRTLYPNPRGNLLDAIRANIHYFYTSVQARGCTEIFPYGRFEDGKNNAYYAYPDFPEVDLPEYGTFPFPPVDLPPYSDDLVPTSTAPASSAAASSAAASSAPASSAAASPEASMATPEASMAVPEASSA